MHRTHLAIWKSPRIKVSRLFRIMVISQTERIFGHIRLVLLFRHTLERPFILGALLAFSNSHYKTGANP